VSAVPVTIAVRAYHRDNSTEQDPAVLGDFGVAGLDSPNERAGVFAAVEFVAAMRAGGEVSDRVTTEQDTLPGTQDAFDPPGGYC
jgi:hypothetical protein